MSDMMPATKVPTANPDEKLSISVIIPTDQAHCHTDTKTCADICSAPEKKIILARTGTPLLPQTKSNLENDISSFQNLSK